MSTASVTEISAGTQVFVASTAFGLATLAAALDDGLYPPTRRRILVTSNNAAIPEVSPEIAEVVGMTGLMSRFDDVYSYNEVVRPQLPAVWRPRAVDLMIFHRHLQLCWALGDDPVHLVLESIQTPPALVLAQTFADARIDVYGDGLMSYGPTRVALPSTVAARIERLVHLDLVPGVSPLLLSEFGVPAQLITDRSFVAVVDQLGDGADGLTGTSGASGDQPGSGGRRVAVLLGQYLSAAGLLTAAEEDELHAAMVRGAVAAGFTTLVFKPHPSAPAVHTAGLTRVAADAGAELRIHPGPALVETWFGDQTVGLVVGCFSTALMTAASLYGKPVARVGTELVLARLAPFENSNRIPAVIVDAAVSDLADLGDRGGPGGRAGGAVDRGTAARIDELVRVVGYCMQPERYPALRATTVAHLRARQPGERRYVTRRRLVKLDLPGQGTPRGFLRTNVRRLIGPRRYERLAAVLRRRTRARSDRRQAAGPPAGSRR